MKGLQCTKILHKQSKTHSERAAIVAKYRQEMSALDAETHLRRTRAERALDAELGKRRRRNTKHYAAVKKTLVRTRAYI